MRRIKLILAAAASMAVLMVLTAAPALADVELEQSVEGSSGPVTLVGSTGGGSLDIGDNDIDFDGISSLGDGSLGDCVLIGDTLFCVGDDDDGNIDIGGSGGVSQSFEIGDTSSGDVEPSISIG